MMNEKVLGPSWEKEVPRRLSSVSGEVAGKPGIDDGI